MNHSDLQAGVLLDERPGDDDVIAVGSERPVLEIDVVSDMVCPWCFIGKRQLDTALARRRAALPGEPPPRVSWRAYQLNPDLPAEGIDRAEHYRRKFGTAAAAMIERVRNAGRGIGLELKLERITRQPNTLAAHALVELAADGELQTRLAEALFQAFFMDGRDIGDPAVLLEIATGVGMRKELAEAALDPEGSVQQLVAAGESELREFGVNGVPLCIIGREDTGRIAVSGAQGADALIEAMRRFD